MQVTCQELKEVHNRHEELPRLSTVDLSGGSVPMSLGIYHLLTEMQVDDKRMIKKIDKINFVRNAER